MQALIADRAATTSVGVGGMRVSEERLSTVLTRTDHTEGLLQVNPVAALIVESMAAARPRFSQELREAGEFFLDLLRANEADATRLSLPVAMRVFAQDEVLPVSKMRSYLAGVAERDVLLGLSIHALCANPNIRSSTKRCQAETDAVVRMLYLLVRMFEVQEEADALDRALIG